MQKAEEKEKQWHRTKNSEEKIEFSEVSKG